MLLLLCTDTKATQYGCLTQHCSLLCIRTDHDQPRMCKNIVVVGIASAYSRLNRSLTLYTVSSPPIHCRDPRPPRPSHWNRSSILSWAVPLDATQRVRVIVPEVGIPSRLRIKLGSHLIAQNESSPRFLPGLPCAFASAPPLSFVHSTATEFTGFEATRPRLRHPEARLLSAFNGKIRNTENRGNPKVCPSARVLRFSRESRESWAAVLLCDRTDLACHFHST